MPDAENASICCSCNQSLSETEFYKSHSNFYAKGYLPICKDCFAAKYGEYLAEYHSSKMAMQRMCMAFDIFFDEDIFDTCDTGTDAVLGKYFRKMNMAQYKRKTFDTTIQNSDGFGLLSGERKIPVKRTVVVDAYGNEYEHDVKSSDVDKWGAGFEPTDYEILNNHYRKLTSANPQIDSNIEIFILDLCYTKMQQMKAVREGRVEDYNKLTESYRKSFSQAGFKTVKDASANEEFTIGVNAELIEKYTPAEYYKNKQLYKDFDNIGDYISRFLFRPLKNLMHGSKDRDAEFYIKEEEGSNIYAEDD